jgi:hypothetical protein
MLAILMRRGFKPNRASRTMPATVRADDQDAYWSRPNPALAVSVPGTVK